tara:strand:+ start:819 stop:1532 length:714 start_codon:yes stop_codon:yes gene_type:complete
MRVIRSIYLMSALIFISSSSAFAGSFSQTKKLLPKVYKEHEITFYCGCNYTGKKVDLDSCEYIPRKNQKRASRIEWEHVVPASGFGKFFKEWTEGHPKCVKQNGKKYKGRKCAGKVNKNFKEMEADPINLVPSVGEVNGDRSNYPYAIISGEERKYGECDFEIKGKKAEPRKEARGDIARIYFYMDKKYPGYMIINESNGKMLSSWDKDDPVSLWEIERNKRINEVFGAYNEFVSTP